MMTVFFGTQVGHFMESESRRLGVMAIHKRKQKCDGDRFAQIAAELATAPEHVLVEPQPPRLPRRILPSRKSDPAAAFAPQPKLDTKEKLQQELKRQQRRYARFLLDLTPALKSSRIKVALEQFDWRLQTEDDARDANRVSLGMGRWEKVRIPHYGGPLGRAVTYYRTTFRVTRAMLEKGTLFICFKGVDYKAHAFMNGAYLGSHEGFFAPFELDFTRVARPGNNTLVVKVENDAICMGNDSWGEDGHLYDGDKLYAATGPGWDDPEIGWHHCPPGMGIYQDVFVEARSPIHIHDIFVRPLAGQKRAEAWIEICNCHPVRHEVGLEISVFGRNFRKTVFRDRECKLPGPVGPTVNCFRIPFDVPEPRMWELETPWLYQIQVRLLDKENRTLDTAARQFGMRSFTMDETNSPKGWYYLNGRKIRLHGANTMGFEQQDVMKKDWKQLIDDILLAKICHMNFLRLTQRPVQEEVYDFCDRLGLMTQTDLPLFAVLRRNQFAECVRQAEEMERLVRGHPCNVQVSFINEPFPNAWDKPHRHLVPSELEAFFEAAEKTVHLANPDRVVKPVDGDYDPPHAGLPDNHCYTCWYNGHGLPVGKLIKGYWQKIKPDWNYGCGEFGAEGLDPVETMLKYYPRTWLPKRAGELWRPERVIKSQTGRFHYMWFPTQRTIQEWAAESQRFQAWATRTMTEAFRRDARMVSIAIHLFIDAFPAGWMKAIMDVDRNPKPAFFAYREALTPVAANIRTDRNTYFSGERLDMDFWVCNDLPEELAGHELCYQVRCGKEVLFSARVPAGIPPMMPAFQDRFAYQLPEVSTRSCFSVELAVRNAKGRIVHDTSKEVVVFPRSGTRSAPVHVLGDKGGAAWNLALELGLRPSAWRQDLTGIILADSLTAVRENKTRLQDAVRSGARLVLTDLLIPEKELEAQRTKQAEIALQLGGTTVKFYPAGMNPMFFVNCSTGHPLVAGFAGSDFFLWHNTVTGMIDPILPLTMEAEGMEPVLLTGAGSWASQEWRPVPAAAVKRLGKGVLIISLVNLNGRTKTNPVAREYALRILGLSESATSV
jgi:hypothetical protein